MIFKNNEIFTKIYIYCVKDYFFELCIDCLKISKITPDRIRKIPKMLLRVNFSEKNNNPKNIAVNGSRAPSTEVVVGPIIRIAIFIVSSEIIVGKVARAIEHKNNLMSFIGCN